MVQNLPISSMLHGTQRREPIKLDWFYCVTSKNLYPFQQARISLCVQSWSENSRDVSILPTRCLSMCNCLPLRCSRLLEKSFAASRSRTLLLQVLNSQPLTCIGTGSSHLQRGLSNALGVDVLPAPRSAILTRDLANASCPQLR